jgi:hypothetical protein
MDARNQILLGDPAVSLKLWYLQIERLVCGHSGGQVISAPQSLQLPRDGYSAGRIRI